ncbi:helix-turn-helix transcriptional regulator [Pengzhenrongella sp.]|jgi:DNA-binding CsgD family transcriptional regulator|uniref:helix-turn-helix transcriptional regulator n=1 Tax=Pengzhenrongella sp. TaxID=2888820 RepID=UPI002F93E22A
MSNLALVPEPGCTEPGAEPPIEPPVTSLTRRELIVLDNLAEDVTLEAIASKLWVSRNTVKSQVRSVYRKIGVGTRADAVAWANAAGLR